MDPVTVIGCRMGQENANIREFLTRTARPYEWFDADSEAAQELLTILGVDPAALPVVLDAYGDTMTEASVAKLATTWNLRPEPRFTDYDVAIVGGGPAGLAAAVYAASDGLKTIILDRDVIGGQASHTSMIENFFGFPNGIGGAELAELAAAQVNGFGGEILQFAEVVDIAQTAESFKLHVSNPDSSGVFINARTLIAASGMEWRKLDAPGVEDLLGRGVYYGAGRAEAAQCREDPVVVVGAGNSAGQAAMYLANSGATVTMMVRGDSLTKSMSTYLVDRIVNHPSVHVKFKCEVTEAVAKHGRLHHITDSFGMSVPASAMFLCLGGQPRTAWAEEIGAQCTKGFIRTGPDLQSPDGTCAVRPPGWTLERGPFDLETNVPRFFAAGDVRFGSPRRVGGAVGDGAAAVAMIHRAVDE